MATFDLDTFTGTNGTTLASHTPDAGGSIAVASGSSIFLNGSGAAYFTGGTNNALAIYAGTPASANYTVQATFSVVSTSPSAWGVGGRRTGASTGYQALSFNGNWCIGKSVGDGGGSFLVSGIPNGVTAGHTYTLQLVMSGTTITFNLSIDGGSFSQIAQATDSTYATAGTAGFLAYNINSTTGFLITGFSAFDPPAALAAGAASAVSVGATTSNMLVANATGGSNTYTVYQWYRSTSSFTISTATLLSGATSTVLADSGLSQNSTYVYTNRVTDSAGSLSLSNYVTITTGSKIAVNDANVYWSPNTWLISGSNFAKTNMPGNGVKFGFTGTSLKALLNVSSLTGATATAGDYPVLAWTIDDGALNTHQLVGTDSIYTLTASLSSGTHTLQAWFNAMGGTTDCWNTPVDCLRIDGFVVDGGSSSVACSGNIAIRPNTFLMIGDSLEENRQSDTASGVANANAMLGFPQQIAAAFNAEPSIIAHQGQGYVHSYAIGNGANVPPYSSVQNLIWSGQTITTGGTLTVSPTYCAIFHGTNDNGFSLTTATVNSCLTTLRTQCGPNTKIFLCVPPGQYQASVITSTPLPDANTFLINLGAAGSLGVGGNGASPWSVGSGIHLTDLGVARIGAQYTAAMQAALLASTDPGAANVKSGTTYSINSTARTGTLSGGGIIPVPIPGF